MKNTLKFFKKMILKRKTLIALTSVLVLSLMFVYAKGEIFADKPVDWLETAFGTVTLKDTITLSYTKADKTLTISGSGTLQRSTFDGINTDGTYKGAVENIVIDPAATIKINPLNLFESNLGGTTDKIEQLFLNVQ